MLSQTIINKNIISEICVKMHFPLVYKRLECIDLKEMQVYRGFIKIVLKLAAGNLLGYLTSTENRVWKKIFLKIVLPHKVATCECIPFFSKLAKI